MKNLYEFEEFVFDPLGSKPIKQYGEKFPLSNLSVGDKVMYVGADCEVAEVDEFSMILNPMNGTKRIITNQSLFNERGYISKENKPKKM
jgi:hypothetical protein